MQPRLISQKEGMLDIKGCLLKNSDIWWTFKKSVKNSLIFFKSVFINFALAFHYQPPYWFEIERRPWDKNFSIFIIGASVI